MKAVWAIALSGAHGVEVGQLDAATDLNVTVVFLLGWEVLSVRPVCGSAERSGASLGTWRWMWAPCSAGGRQASAALGVSAVVSSGVGLAMVGLSRRGPVLRPGCRENRGAVVTHGESGGRLAPAGASLSFSSLRCPKGPMSRDSWMSSLLNKNSGGLGAQEVDAPGGDHLHSPVG